MHIGILAKGGAEWMGGLAYTLNLVRALSQLAVGERPRLTLITQGAEQTAELRELDGIIPIVIPGPPADPAAARGRTDPALLDCIRRHGIDVVYPVMRAMADDFPIPWIGWVPDLQHRHLPALFSEAERAERDRRCSELADRAPLLVFSSAAALADFERAWPGHRAPLRVLHFHTIVQPEWFEADPTATVRSMNLLSRFLLLPNQFWKHKNHLTAFQAMDILVRRGVDVHLVCTGRLEDPRDADHAPSLRAFLGDHRLCDRVRLLGLVPRQTLIQLMRASYAVVQPSLFEGWSTVVEDARALGKRIFLSDISVHREQKPPGAVYFEPTSPESLADRLAESWSGLVGGPDVEAERQVSATQSIRVREFARTFHRIAAETVGRAIPHASPTPAGV